MDKKIGWLVAGLVVFVLLSAFLAFNLTAKNGELNQAVKDHSKAIDAKDAEINLLTEELGVTNVELDSLKTNVEELQKEFDNTKTELANVEEAKADLELEKDTTIAELEERLAEEESTEAMFENGYLFDGMPLTYTFSKLLTDRHLNTLIDSEITFDSDEYDVEEIIELTNVKITRDDSDFNGEVFMELPEGAIEYRVEIDNQLFTEFGASSYADKEFTISFLGEELTITDWEVGSIDIKRGDTYNIKEGESELIDEKLLEVLFVSENNKATIAYDGVTETIKELDSENINGIDVYVESIMYNDRVGGLVTLRVGSDVDERYEDGDEYSEDSNYVWLITADSIGIVLNEEYVGNDEDDELRALGYGESLSLPENFAMLNFIGLSDEDYVDIKMDVRSACEHFIRLTGEFETEDEGYQTLYISKSSKKIYGYDRDNGIEVDECEYLDRISNVFIEDSIYKIKADGASVFVKNMAEFNKNFTGMSIDSTPITTEDEDFISIEGIKVKAVKDFSDNDEFRFSVPEEPVEAIVSVTMG